MPACRRFSLARRGATLDEVAGDARRLSPRSCCGAALEQPKPRRARVDIAVSLAEPTLLILPTKSTADQLPARTR